MNHLFSLELTVVGYNFEPLTHIGVLEISVTMGRKTKKVKTQTSPSGTLFLEKWIVNPFLILWHCLIE